MSEDTAGRIRPLSTRTKNGICYFDSGQGDASETVILLHGLGNSLQYWIRVAPFLVGKVRVVALDIPGFGRSRAPERRTLESYASSVTEFLVAIEAPSYHLVGHSMGAIVAGAVAAEERSGAQSLLLLGAIPITAIEIIRNPCVMFHNPAIALNLAFQFLGGMVPLGKVGAELVAKSSVLRRAALWPFLHDVDDVPKNELSIALAGNGGWGPLQAARLGRSADLDELLPTPDGIPVRVLNGGSDRLVGYADIQSTVKHYRAVDCALLTNVGHWPLLERPLEVARFILGYLKGGDMDD